MRSNLRQAHNIADLREIARRRLPRFFFEFVDRGTEDEVGLRHNRKALDELKLQPRVLADVDRRSQQIELFGKAQDMPVAIAPTGIAGLLWHGGEVALARAAAKAGVPFTLATPSIASMEKVTEQAGGRLWYQLYLWADRALAYRMVERARDNAFEALILTVDTAVSPNREYNVRNGFAKGFRFTPRSVADVLMHPRWLTGTLGRYLLDGGLPAFANYPLEVRHAVITPPDSRTSANPSQSWADLKELRRRWPRTLIVKGIMAVDDARLAVDCGADAVIVSNHGGRNIDSALAPIEVLPQIVDAVGQRTTVMVDSGFRRGSDIVKALALGAKAVMLGRGPLYGTAACGEAGATRALSMYRDEIDRTLALLGCRSVHDVARYHVVAPAHSHIASNFEQRPPRSAREESRQRFETVV